MVRTTSATRLVHLGQGRTPTSVSNFVVSQASSANGCKRNATATSLGPFIPIQTQPGSEESMSLIVQLGTTVVATTTQQQVQVPKSPLTLSGGYPTRIVNSAFRDQSPRTSATNNKCNVQHMPEPQQSSKMKLIELQEAVAIEQQKLEPVEVKKEEPEEKKHLPYYGIPFEAQTEEQRMEIVKFVLQDHNYGAPPPASPPLSPQHHGKTAQSSMNPLCTNNFGSTGPSYSYGSGLLALRDAANNDDDDANSVISSNPGREVEPEGEETETAPEGEGDDEDSVTRCVCEFEHDDGYMICCDKCFVWQHVDCMGIDRMNIPDEYMCERCQPRRVDRQRARTLQLRKREELLNTDTCSDTSSTTSTDNESAVVNAGPSAPKRRAASSVNRRKSDQSRSANKKSMTNNSGSNNHSNNSNSNNSGSNNSGNNASANNHNNSVSSNVTKQRQRRDSVKEHVPATTQRRSSANQSKKKEPVKVVPENKKPPTRRKSKRCLSEEEGQDVWEKSSSGAMQQLRQWIDNYEEAVTNHYSPELRARISSIKVNGIHSDLKTGNILSMGSGATKCRLSQTAPGVRILVSTAALSAHQPVIELRGKYMLSTQHRPAALNSVSSKRSRPPPGPFIFFYRLPKDGTEVCVDTRTYGNDARFIRRSCKPNAEVRHCIEKGILHLYIVTATTIEKNCEITIGHDGAHDTGSLGNSSGNSQPLCACGNSKECTAFVKGNGALEISDRERRRRGRRAFSSEERDGLSNQTQNNHKISETNNSSIDISPPTRRHSSARSPTKQQPSPVLPPPQPPPPPPPPPPPLLPQQETTQEDESNEATDQKSETSSEQQEKKRKLTREERKMEAIMKAFERLEKAEQRRQENQAKQAHRKEEVHMPLENKRNAHHEEKEDVPKQRSARSTTQDRPRRKRRKGRGRSNSNNNSSGSGNSAPLRRRTRLNSGDSDMTSADEAAPLVASPNEPMCANTNASCSQQGSPVSAAAGLLLALANGNNVSQPNSVSPYQPHTPPHTDNIPRSTTPQGQVFCESSGSGSSQGSTPPTPLSSACLLVAAAVGPLAPGFKFPKTKKVLMNEWLNKSPDPLSTSSIVPPPMSSPVLSRPGDLPLNPSDLILNPAVADSYGFSTQHSPSKSLATLAQAANRVALGTSTSPIPSFCRSAGTKGNAQSPGGRVGSAKKRWLRQAISEECDSPTPNSCASPNSRGGSPPPCPDYVTPLKKRRVARESMSSEQSFTPPTTPTMLAEQHLAGASPTSQKCGQYDGANMNLVAEEEDTITSPGEEDNAVLHEYDETEEKCESNFDEHSNPVDADAHCSRTGSCHQVVLGDADRVQSDGCEASLGIDATVNEKLHIQESEEEDEEDEEEDGAVHSLSPDRSQEILDEKATELKTDVAHSSEETEEEVCRGFEDQDLDCRYDALHEVDNEREKLGVQEVDKAADPKEDGLDSDQKVEAESTQTASSSSATAQPAKRKVRTLSISEYRQRKQRNSEAENMPRGNENEEATLGSPASRVRTNSTSSSSSLSSEDDMPSVNKSLLDTTPALSTLPLFLQSDGVDDKKGAGGEEMNYMRWNSAPTLVERQRENLTERLRREFGLFLSDDEEQERVRKQGLTQEATKDGKKKSVPPPPPPPPLPPPEANTVAVSQHLMGMYSTPQKLTYSSVLVPNNVPVSYIPSGASGGYAAAGSSRQAQGYGPYPMKAQAFTTTSYPAGLGGKGITSATGKGPASTAAIYQTPTTNVGSVKAAPKYLLTTPPPPPPPPPPPLTSPTGSQYVVQAPYVTPAPAQQVMLVGSSRTSQTPSHFVTPSVSGNAAPSGNTTTFYTAAAAKAYYPPPPLPNLPPPPPPPRT